MSDIHFFLPWSAFHRSTGPTSIPINSPAFDVDVNRTVLQVSNAVGRLVKAQRDVKRWPQTVISERTDRPVLPLPARFSPSMVRRPHCHHLRRYFGSKCLQQSQIKLAGCSGALHAKSNRRSLGRIGFATTVTGGFPAPGRRRGFPRVR